MTRLTVSQSSRRRRLHVFLTLLLALAMLLPAAPLAAQEPAPAQPAPAPWVVAAEGGSLLGWETGALLSAAASGASPASLSADALANALDASFPRTRYQGYDLPMQVVTLRLAPGAPAELALRGVQAVDLPAGTIVPGAPDLPTVIVEDGQPAPEAKEVVALPTTPAFVLRSGMVGDERFVVVALSPIYTENGQVRLATAVDAFIPGALPLEGPMWQYTRKPGPDPLFAAAALAATGDDPALATEAASLNAAVDAAVAAMAPGSWVDGSTMDPAALDATDTRVFIVVTKAGLQSVSRAALAAQVTAYQQPTPLNTLKVTRKGVEVPIQVVGDEIRFYVGKVGDRWNVNDVHVVSINAADPSPGMATRSVTPAAAGASSTVLEPGLWVKNIGGVNGYTPQHAGADGDHYFAGEISYGPASQRSIAATLTPAGGLQFGATLPVAPGTSTFTLNLSPRQAQLDSPNAYSLKVLINGATADVPIGPLPYPRWETWPDFTTTAVLQTTARPELMTISHSPVVTPSAVLLDSIAMLRPAFLNLRGQGAVFQAPPGQTLLRWQNAPTAAVYDVTNPAAPSYLAGAALAGGFNDAQPQRRYLVAGGGTFHQPALRKPAAFAFAGVPQANALYITPGAEYRLALEPLLALRNRQGYKSAVVTVQQLYDAYSHGWVDAFAIRRFLQQAYGSWRVNNKPVLLSAVLVGDGTVDPWNFENKAKSLQLIPPFMAQGVDPWLGEAGCDPCFGQLTDPNPTDFPTLGENPHLGDDPEGGEFFSPEIWIGRFPINNVAELSAVVAKLVNYETVRPLSQDPFNLSRARILYVTDNVWKSADERDPAGDFEYTSNTIRSMNPSVIGSDGGGLAPRIYYAPYPAKYVEAELGPWRITDSNGLFPRMQSEINAGVSIFLYNGHANHFNMGRAEAATAGQRGSVVEFNDPLSLSNSNRLFAMLAMTCEAAQFTKPTDSGTVVAERFFVDGDGSAMAVWGPTGQSTSSSHDELQKGFFARLFAARGGYLRMGELTDAGYGEVLFENPEHSYVLRTFVFFGDPLTRLRYDTLDRPLSVPMAFR